VRRPRARLKVETLEDRLVPASFTAASVADLIADINTANQTPEADTITLAPGKTFTLTAENNFQNNYGATGLPVIAAGGGDLTIVGNGDVIERSTAKSTRTFRLIHVAVGASLTLENLTLQGGGGSQERGGAIFNGGNLSLRSVTVQNNIVQGILGISAYGGGIYSEGTLSLENCTVRNNQVLGGAGWWSREGFGSNGGDGKGGGVYVAGGTVTIIGTTITGNIAKKGAKGQHTETGQAVGGGLYIASGSLAYLDAYTVAHVQNNQASTSDPNIYGTYTLLS